LAKITRIRQRKARLHVVPDEDYVDYDRYPPS